MSARRTGSALSSSGEDDAAEDILKLLWPCLRIGGILCFGCCFVVAISLMMPGRSSSPKALGSSPPTYISPSEQHPAVSSPELARLVAAVENLESQLSEARVEARRLADMKSGSSGPAPITTPSPPPATPCPTTFGSSDQSRAKYLSAAQAQCDEDFGYGLIDKWRKVKSTHCADSEDGGMTVANCYRIRQTRHMGDDNFCDFKNVAINFKQVRFMATDAGTKIDNGGLMGRCNKAHNYLNSGGNFPPKLAQQVTAFQPATGELECDMTVEKPTMLITRDGFKNMFHSLGDFLTAEITRLIVGLRPEEMQLALFDNFDEGNFFDVWRGMTPNPIIRTHVDYADKVVCFKHAIFNMPAGSAFSWKDAWKPNDCKRSEILIDWIGHVLSGLGVANTAPPAQPKMLFITRKEPPNSGRPMSRMVLNESSLLETVRSKVGIEVTVVDLQEKSFKEQMELFRTHNIMVGVHGAGMTNLLFLPEEAVVIELFPMNWVMHLYRHLTKQSGKTYFSLAVTDPAKHHPSNIGGDKNKEANIEVDVDDFVETVQAAVRVLANAEARITNVKALHSGSTIAG